MFSFKNLFRLVFVAICIFPCATMIFSQPSSTKSFTNWQKSDGLPSSNTAASVKDSLGFLWIATNNGLCRFDGPNSIKVFRSPADSKDRDDCLGSSNIRSLFCASDGTLWIGTRLGGVTKFNPRTNQWKTYRHQPGQENSLSNNDVLTIYEDSKSRIWIGTENGLNIYDAENETFQQIHFDKIDGNPTSGKAVLTVLEDERGWIWAGTWAGGFYLLLENKEKHFGENVRHFKPSLDRASSNVWKLFQDSKNRIWVGTHGGGFFLMETPIDASNKIGEQNWKPRFHHYSQSIGNAKNYRSTSVQDIHEDKFGTLWFGTDYGLYLLPQFCTKENQEDYPETLTFECYTPNPNDDLAIIGDNIMDIYEDSQGIIWLSATNGLSQYNWKSNQIKNAYTKKGMNEFPYTSCLHTTDNGDIWAGVWRDGLLKFRIENGKLVEQESNLNNLLNAEYISTTYVGKGDLLYLGTEKGIIKLNTRTLDTVQYSVPNWVSSTIQDFFIKSIFIDNDGLIWFGTKVGLFTIDPDTKKYTIYEPSSESSDAVSDYSINHIIQDKHGHLWVATYNGLNRVRKLDDGQIKFEKFRANPLTPKDGPIDNAITHLKESGNKLYIGTLSGLCSYNYETEEFESYNLNEHKYWVRSMEKDDDGNLWLSTNEAILFFDVTNSSYRIFDRSDGVIDYSFRLGASTVGADGVMYFAFRTGLTYFNPKELSVNAQKPPVYITKVAKMGPNGVEVVEGINGDEIYLNHDDYRISVDFAVLNYNRPDKNKYAYRLVGFEEEWHEADLGTPAVYTNLAPQSYTLQVKAANNDGIWNEKGNSISIVRRAAFWETGWFYFAVIIFIASVVYLFTRWYTNKIIKHNEELKKYNDSLSQEIANRKRIEDQLSEYNKELKRSNTDLEQFAYIASHDLREPLRVIGNFSGLIAHRYQNKLDTDANEYIDFIQDGVVRMSNLINSLLTYSKVGKKEDSFLKLNLNNIVEKKIIDLTKLIEEKGAEISVGNLPEIFGEKEQIGMVFFNLINNGIKFNENEKPVVYIKAEKSFDNKVWLFSVADNGIGIDKQYKEQVFGIFKRLHSKSEYKGTGIGLAVCKKIIQRHGGDIWFESSPGEGTTFYFTLRNNLKPETRLPSFSADFVS